MSVLISMTETQQPALRSSARTSSEASAAQKCLHFCIAEPSSEGLRRSPLKGKYRRISSKERLDAFFFYPEIWIEGNASNNKPAAKAAPQIATIKRRLYGI